MQIVSFSFFVLYSTSSVWDSAALPCATVSTFSVDFVVSETIWSSLAGDLFSSCWVFSVASCSISAIFSSSWIVSLSSLSLSALPSSAACSSVAVILSAVTSWIVPSSFSVVFPISSVADSLALPCSLVSSFSFVSSDPEIASSSVSRISIPIFCWLFVSACSNLLLSSFGSSRSLSFFSVSVLNSSTVSSSRWISFLAISQIVSSSILVFVSKSSVSNFVISPCASVSTFSLDSFVPEISWSFLAGDSISRCWRFFVSAWSISIISSFWWSFSSSFVSVSVLIPTSACSSITAVSSAATLQLVSSSFLVLCSASSEPDSSASPCASVSTFSVESSSPKTSWSCLDGDSFSSSIVFCVSAWSLSSIFLSSWYFLSSVSHSNLVSSAACSSIAVGLSAATLPIAPSSFSVLNSTSLVAASSASLCSLVSSFSFSSANPETAWSSVCVKSFSISWRFFVSITSISSASSSHIFSSSFSILCSTSSVADSSASPCAPVITFSTVPSDPETTWSSMADDSMSSWSVLVSSWSTLLYSSSIWSCSSSFFSLSFSAASTTSSSINLFSFPFTLWFVWSSFSVIYSTSSLADSSASPLCVASTFSFASSTPENVWASVFGDSISSCWMFSASAWSLFPLSPFSRSFSSFFIPSSVPVSSSAFSSITALSFAVTK